MMVVVFEANFKHYRLNVTNNDNLTPENNYRFTIEVPETGSYLVTVEVEAINDCYICCSSNSCNIGEGYPFWRGVSSLMNTFPPPPTIYVDPIRIACY